MKLATWTIETGFFKGKVCRAIVNIESEYGSPQSRSMYKWHCRVVRAVDTINDPEGSLIPFTDEELTDLTDPNDILKDLLK